MFHVKLVVLLFESLNLRYEIDQASIKMISFADCLVSRGTSQLKLYYLSSFNHPNSNEDSILAMSKYVLTRSPLSGWYRPSQQSMFHVKLLSEWMVLSHSGVPRQLNLALGITNVRQYFSVSSVIR